MCCKTPQNAGAIIQYQMLLKLQAEGVGPRVHMAENPIQSGLHVCICLNICMSV